jgi:hypothetical protein
MSVPGFPEFVASIRATVEPVAHLTDADLEASTDLPPPVIRLLLGLRASLREYDATREAGP